MVQQTQQPTRWQPGSDVHARSERWRVERSQAFAACELVWLTGIGRSNRQRRLALLSPFDRLQPADSSARMRRATYRQWLHALRQLVIAATPFGRLRAAADARIHLHGWQMEPALAMMNGFASRLLVADEVGLGKTIQAALIVAELRALAQAARTLILTPAGLRDQWMEELRDRFAIDATVVDAGLVRRTISELAGGTNPWSTWPVIISSLDFVKRTEVLKALDVFTWDLLIVDEAHLCALAPERSAALRTLAGNARRVVLLTATPHDGDDRSFVALCTTGAFPQEPPVVMFRRARADIGLQSDRHVHLLRVRCTAEERRMHQLLARYTRKVWSDNAATPDARLVMIVLRKRALSSAMSLLRSLERRAGALFDRPASEHQLILPFAGDADVDEQTREDEDPLAGMSAPGMEPRRERAWLDRLIEAARRVAGHESKMDRLLRLLGRMSEPAIVFTEYRDTARWLTTMLQPAGPLVLLHGGMSRRERQDAAREFTAGSARVLIATDAAGEGLNLHQRCRLVVNLELPWNPMRLEQRVGRVDRLGQCRRPHAVHLVASGTAEEEIVARLVVRQERVKRSIGSVGDAVGNRRGSSGGRLADREKGATSEQAVAEAVMTGRIDAAATAAPRATPYRTVDVGAIARDEQARLENIRRVIGRRAPGSTRPGGASEVLLALLPRRAFRRHMRHGMALPRGFTCLFACRFMTADGDVLEETPVYMRVPITKVSSAPPAAQWLIPVPSQLADAARAAVADRLRDVVVIHDRVMQAAAERDRVMASRDSRRRPIAIQPGIFDRRAIKAREEADVISAARQQDRATGQRTDAARGGGVSLAEPRLVLVLASTQG